MPLVRPKRCRRPWPNRRPRVETYAGRVRLSGPLRTDERRISGPNRRVCPLEIRTVPGPRGGTGITDDGALTAQNQDALVPPSPSLGRSPRRSSLARRAAVRRECVAMSRPLRRCGSARIISVRTVTAEGGQRGSNSRTDVAAGTPPRTAQPACQADPCHHRIDRPPTMGVLRRLHPLVRAQS